MCGVILVAKPRQLMSMKTLLLTPVLLLFLLTACTSEKKNDFVEFSDLSAADSLRWQEKLMDAVHAEMVDSVEHVKFEPEINMPYCGIRSVLNISISDDRVMVAREIDGEIKKAIFAYYLTNRKTNDGTNNQPMYSRLNLKDIQSTLDESKKQLANARSESNDSLMIAFYASVVNEWEIRLRAIKTLRIAELPEIFYQAHIEVSGRHIDPKTKKQVFKEIVESYYDLREKLAQEYFGKSYLELYYLEQQRKKQKDLDRMTALRVLLPIRVVDSEYCRKHKCCESSIEDPPPPPLEQPPPPVIDIPYDRLAEPEIEVIEISDEEY